MALASRQRWLLIGGALAVTLALVAWVGEDGEDAVVAPEERPAAQAKAGDEPAAAAPSGPAAPAASAPAVAPAPGSQPPAPPAPGPGPGAAAPAAPPSGLGFRTPGPPPGSPPQETRDLFAQQTWHVEPPPPPPGPPEAPPLPFEYIGKIVDGGKVTVYLEDESERSIAIRPGDVINGTYRVQRITPTAITFLYIPLKKQQVLEIGSPK